MTPIRVCGLARLGDSTVTGNRGFGVERWNWKCSFFFDMLKSFITENGLTDHA
jgi:hypothetical protein